MALSSLTTEDAVAYRAFLRHPAPRSRWIGPATARSSPLWRPFTGSLSPCSTAYALSELSAMFRWLTDKRYVLANPYSGVRVRGMRAAGLDTTRGLSGGEWNLVRTVANGLEWSYGWEPRAAQRMRFVLDFGFGTGLPVRAVRLGRRGIHKSINLGLRRGEESIDHIAGFVALAQGPQLQAAQDAQPA